MKPSILFFYALPALPLAALTLPLYVIVPVFYTETLGLPLAITGMVLVAIRLFDAFNDPLIGWTADRWKPRLGRRRSMFLAGVPVAALGAFMLFWPRDGAGPGYLLSWGLVLSVGYTAVVLPYSAWGAELEGDYRRRTNITGAREAMTLAGTLVAITLPFAVGIGDTGWTGGLSLLGISVAAAMIVLGLIAVWKVPEPAEYTLARLSMRSGIRHMAANKAFLRLIAAFFLNGLANGIPASLFLYFVSARLGAPDWRGPLLFIYFLAGIAGMPLAVILSSRLGKHRAWSWAMIGACAAFAMVPLLETGQVFAFALVCVMTGLFLGFDLSLPAAIQADVIDVDTLGSGEQRSGLYFAAWSLATKSSLALGTGIVFPLLSLFGFNPSAAENSAHALDVLAVLYAWLPVAFKVAAIALMWNFPLGDADHARLRQRIERRRFAGLGT